MFAGFAVAFQIVAAVTLFVPLLFLDLKHLPFFSLGYFERYAPIVFVLGLGLFLHRFLRHVASVRATVAFTDVDRRTTRASSTSSRRRRSRPGCRSRKSGASIPRCSTRSPAALAHDRRRRRDPRPRGGLDDDELAAVVAHEIAQSRTATSA